MINMLSSPTLNTEKILDIALDCIFPTSETIEPEILKEITKFLEQHEPSVPAEDAEIVRGEIRKAMIHFKNRPYLYKTRKKIQDILQKNENWKRFVISPDTLSHEMEEAGLNSDEVAMLRSSIESAEETYNKLSNIPQPN